MNARGDEIRRVVAELDVHVAAVEANLAVLKALLADDEATGARTSANERTPVETDRPGTDVTTGASPAEGDGAGRGRLFS